MIKIGVLCIEGDFPEHLTALKRYPNVVGVDVRSVDTLKECDGLILPGGESTTHGIVGQKYGLLKVLQAFVRSGRPVWGTCAGLIALSDEICDVSGTALSQFSIGGLHIRTCRNYFGRQSQSAVLPLEMGEGASESFFIRSPAILSVLDARSVKVLAYVHHRGERVAVAVEQGNILGTAFHPELVNEDHYWSDLFVNKVLKYKNLQSGPQRKPVLSMSREPSRGVWSVKTAFPRMLQGGVIMDVVNGAQARIAEAAGACAVMALERIPADIKAHGGIARMSDPALIKEIMASVSVPVMAKARIGHFGEARILEALDVDCIDESEVLTPADEKYHINKHKFQIPFVCGAKDLGEALRRIAEGAAMIRLKGNAGTGNVKEAVRHARLTFGEIRKLKSLDEDELFDYAKTIQAPLELVRQTRALGRLPVVTFAAGGIATPADVLLMMEMGCDGVFVGSGIFKGDNPKERAEAVVQACTYYRNANIVATVSENLGKAMVGILETGETYSLNHQDSKL